eukprot:13517800-Ditylum_brightwellii.AAC.1
MASLSSWRRNFPRCPKTSCPSRRRKCPQRLLQWKAPPEQPRSRSRFLHSCVLPLRRGSRPGWDARNWYPSLVLSRGTQAPECNYSSLHIEHCTWSPSYQISYAAI